MAGQRTRSTTDLPAIVGRAAAVSLFDGLSGYRSRALGGSGATRGPCRRRVRHPEGEESEELLVIVEGTADVYERQPAGRTQRVAQLTAGDFFGELGLPSSQPRTADVRCGPRLSLLSRADNVSCFNDRSEVHVSVTALGCPEVRGYETADGTMTLGLAYLVQGTKAI